MKRLIDADAVAIEIKKTCEEAYNLGIAGRVILGRVLDVINAHPSVKLEERTSEMIGLNDVNRLWGTVECGNCNAFINGRDKYCPRCGVRFKEVQG